MPFIIPSKRKSRTKFSNGLDLGVLSKYKDVEDSWLFILQRRKARHQQNIGKKGHRPLMRIITKAMYPLYEVAYGEDEKSIKDNEWAYILNELPKIVPKNIMNNDELATKWVVAHFTQVAFTAQGIPEEKPDDEDDEDFGSDSIDFDNMRGSWGSTPPNQTFSPRQGGVSHRSESVGGDSMNSPSTREAAAAAVADKIKKKKSIVEKASSRVAKFTSEFKSKITNIQENQADRAPQTIPRATATHRAPSAAVALTGTLKWSKSTIICLVLALNTACLVSRDLTWSSFVVFLAMLNLIGLVLCLKSNKLAPLTMTLQSSGQAKRVGSSSSSSSFASSHSEGAEEGSTGGSDIGSIAVGTTMQKQPAIEEWKDHSFGPGYAQDFLVRVGPNYKKNKKKDNSEDPFYEISTVDLFVAEMKVEHIAQNLQLPPVPPDYQPVGNCPYFFVVNMQLPLYSPPMSPFSKVDDGKGVHVVLVFSMRKEARKWLAEGTTNAAKLTRIFLEADGQAGLKERARLKAIPRLVNEEDVSLGILAKYNAKPFMTGPICHTFHRGANYLEVDIDIHKFIWPARRGIYSFTQSTELIKKLIVDLGYVVQGDDDDQLPEQMLCAARLSGIDMNKMKKIG